MKPNRSTSFLSQEEFDRIKGQYAKFNEPWETTEVEELKAMAADNLSIEDISVQLQRTPNSVKMKLKALGLYFPKPAPNAWTNDEESKLIELYSKDIPFEEIAEELGRSINAVVSRLVRLRIHLFN